MNIKTSNQKGRTIEDRRKDVARRREIVAKLYNGEMKQKDIATQLGVTVSTINGDIKVLIREGKITPKEIYASVVNERRERVKELWKKYYNIKGIAKELKIDVRVVKSDINFLWIKGLIELQKQETPRRERKPKENVRKGKKRNIDNNIANKKYFLMMVSKIKELYVKENFEEALKYLETLCSEIKLDGENKRKIEQIRRAIQDKLEIKSEREENLQRNNSRKRFLERLKILNYANIEPRRIAQILNVPELEVLKANLALKNEKDKDDQKER